MVAGLIVVSVGTALLVTFRRLPPAFSAATTSAPTTAAASTTTAPPPVATRSAAPVPSSPRAAPAEPFVPTSLSLAAFHVTAAVEPVLTAGGVLAPPDDPARIGWWGAGSLAGAAAGTTVVVGHVDGPAGPGALYRLVHARPGDRVTVAGSNGEHVTYAVTSLQYHGKGDPLPTSLFTSTGPPHLVLISCGGAFDRSDDQYADNVVVQASPV